MKGLLEEALLELSTQERRTLAYASNGLTDKEIAVKLGVSLSTVRTYWLRLFKKIEASNRASAVATYVKAQRSGPGDEHSQTRLAIVEGLGPVLVVDAERKIAIANKRLYDFLGLAVGSLEGVPVTRVIPSSYHAFHRALDAVLNGDDDAKVQILTFVRKPACPDQLVTASVTVAESPNGRYAVLLLETASTNLEARRRGWAHGVSSPRLSK